MGQEVVWIVKALILPPGGIILLGMFGLVIGRRSLVGGFLITLSLAALYLLSTPYIASRLMMEIETYPALSPEEISISKAEAIVVLGGGRHSDAPEYEGDTVSGMLLERLRYAAFLARLSNLQVIPTGGSVRSDGPSEARLAKGVLEKEFGISVAAIEENSRTTWENATMTAALLQRLEIGSVFLVTHAMHMPRSMAMFQRAGIDVIAAPTVFNHRNDPLNRFSDWLPGPIAMKNSYFALHELLGGAWYALRHQWNSIIR